MREDWIEVELGEVCNFIGGGTPSKANSDFWSGNLPWASIKDMKGDTLNETQDYITELGLKNSSSNLALPDEIILATRITPGKPIISKIKTAINQDLKVVKPKIKIDSKYLFYSFKSFEKKIVKASSGTTVLGINLNSLNSVIYPLAPLPIQRAIVLKIENLFASLDKGIADLKTAQEQLKVYRQAVLEQGLTGVFTKKFRKENPGLEVAESLYQKIQNEIEEAYKKACSEALKNGKNKPKDQRKNKKALNVSSYLPEIPKTWEYYRLEDLTYLVTDGTHFTPKYQKEGVKFLSVKNVRPFLIKDEDIKYISQEEHKQFIERCKPENGDILYTKVGATYGYASKVQLDYEFSIFVSLCLIKPVYKYLKTEFLEYLMNSEIVFRQARQRVSGSGVPDLHLVEIRDFKIPLPSVDEQKVIIREIESRLSVCDKVEQSISEALEKAEALRQSILKKAFEGKLLSEAEIAKCKQEADYEPAAKLLERIKMDNRKKY
ncbi:MAG: restriction endonuclease subunit S [Bacteroidales bacterium]